MIKVQFKQWSCKAQFVTYSNKRNAIQLVNIADGSLAAIATVNMPNHKLNNENEIFIKDWGENEGMVEALREAGIVGKLLGHIESGWVDVPKLELLYNPTQ